MNDLTDRQRTLLMLLVRDYIETAQPVSSLHLVGRYHLDMSSATIRNEMSALTEMGYLRQPHTSAGRIPSEDGYRYFVSHMIEQAELPEAVQNTISHQFHQSRPDVEQWMTLAASVLAHQSQAVSLVTAPHAEKSRFKHVELISTQGRQVLMVLVMWGGEVSQQVLSLAEPVSQERLSGAARRINSACQGRTTDETISQLTHADALETDILTLVLQEMRRADDRASGNLYYDGLSNVLSEPEFNASDPQGTRDARRALRLFDERSTLQELLSQTVLNTGLGSVQVLIGGEGTWEELRQCSMVLARYGVAGHVTGMLGVMGPMRMSYGKTIPTVRFVANLLSDLVNDSFVENG